MNPKIDELIILSQQRQNTLFAHYLNAMNTPSLKETMQYSLLNGGKRFRSLLTYAAGLTFGAPLENIDIPAASVEMIHTYSLIHDDLPCMDDADLRRGKPASHKVYGEAMATLAGDALHTLAMQIIASHPAPLSAERRLLMIKTLSEAAGPYGMAAGQAEDILLTHGESLTEEALLSLNQLKTGALLTASLELGRLASNNISEPDRLALKTFGDKIGLAFQIQDDILDIEGETETIGKPKGLDVKNQKLTYPHLMGMPGAKEKVATLFREATLAINYLGERGKLLEALIKRMGQRNQ